MILVDEPKYPYRKGRFGLPLDEIKPDFSDFVTSGSGKKLFVEVRDDILRVESIVPIVDLRLEAGVYPSGNIKLHLKSILHLFGVPIYRHPDLFPSEFIRFALAYFAKNGHPVQGVAAEWHPWSVNYKTFKQAYQESQDKIAAGEQTWTGRTLKGLGFYIPDPAVVTVRPDYIMANFRRLDAGTGSGENLLQDVFPVKH